MKTHTLVSVLVLLAVPALARADEGFGLAQPAPSAPPTSAPLSIAPAPAPAGGPEGQGYGTVYGGAGWLEEATSDPGPIGEDARLDFDTGWIAGGALGYRFGGETVEPRAEIDFSARADRSSRATGHAEGGDPSAFTGMANVWVDVPLGAGLTPYAGGGLGAAHVMADDAGGTAGGADTVFAWQLGAGVAYQFTPRVEARADYRWFDAEEPGFQADGESETDFGTHKALLGLRFLF